VCASFDLSREPEIAGGGGQKPQAGPNRRLELELENLGVVEKQKKKLKYRSVKNSLLRSGVNIKGKTWGTNEMQNSIFPLTSNKITSETQRSLPSLPLLIIRMKN
jgi:hypothetical protein